MARSAIKRKKTKKGKVKIDKIIQSVKEKFDDFSVRGLGRSLGMGRITESIFPGGAGVNIDQGTKDDDKFFQRIDEVAPVDLDPTQLHTAQRFSLRAYRMNTRAFRSIENLTNFSIGGGIRFQANDDRVQDLLEKHWMVNEWDEKLSPRFRSMSIFGEQLWPAFVRDTDGLVTLSSISPFRILKVIRDPDNAEDLISADTSKGDISPGSIFKASETDRMNWNIIRRDRDGKFIVREAEEKEKDKQGKPVKGRNAFYFGVNMISGSSRGLPDLLPSLDWLEGHDSFTFAYLERINMVFSVVFDLLIKGGKSREIKKHVNELVKAIRSGMVYGHNDNTEFTMKTPQAASSEADTASKILLRQIQAGTGWGGLFFGDAEDLTRASAAELSIPVAKMIEARQMFFKMALSKIFMFQIEQAEKRGGLNGVKDFRFEIQMPRIFLRDMTSATTALVNLTTTFETAISQGFLTEQEASRVYRTAIELISPLAIQSMEQGEEMPKREIDELVQAMEKSRHGTNRSQNPERTAERKS